MIVACYHAFVCMHAELWPCFYTSIPTSFNILVKMFLHLFHCFLLCVVTRITYWFSCRVLPLLHTYEDS